MNSVILKYNKATEILNKGNFKKALPLFKEVIKIYPCKEAYTNIGNCYRALGLDKEMFMSYKMALEPRIPCLDPSSNTHLHALNNLGLAYYMYGNDDEAIKLYTRAIKEKEDFWEAWWNCSTATLRKASSSGEGFEAGWEMYKARFLKGDAIKLKNRREGLEYWDTISSGDAIVILVEQGIGDSIMFGRYLSLLPFKRVYVQCDPSLEPIFYDFICVRDAIDIDEPSLVAYPICSLGECFLDIPSGDWLKGKFGVKEFPTSEKLNIGIVWSGSPTHANNAYRSTNIERFHRLSNRANLFSLTPGFKGNRHVSSLPITSWTDTAEYINGLDLVIGVDTSVMHMCGSLGVPGLLLQPYKETDFRWGTIPCPSVISTTSVWYDSIRVINNPQSWETVFDRVEELVCGM